ncbi:hypothetical protein RhiirA1_471074 [Rhizophagus irregularis]|uniref:Uncharacterized protein n=1 Tax=Rhizophagus irregularis TaxID=588596 RepID=A0A2I1F1M8_9GLOM|nr:hypothetical protein RhiirA1_471074 [Rhizophagus irregularis]PKY28278.1 hypothetical protein RhiirB3_444366 [Rhizophagus irregularis]CAB5333216.1 unnamed protein product [Rhizophagus irregularis]
MSSMAPGGYGHYGVLLGFTASMNPNLPRIFFKTVNKIYLLTLLYGTTNATACTDLNLPAYQMTIPIEDVFWNFPIVLDSTTNTNVPNKTDYTITVPDAITVPNFIIDLFVIQQIVIECQRV